MKKRLLILVGFLLFFIAAKAQEQSDHLLYIGTGAVDYSSDSNNLNVQMQVGAGLPYNLSTSQSNNIKSEFGFPYNVLYIPPTFIVDRFEVSKGYYSDRVNIKWEFGANQDKIIRTEIYRKPLGSITPYQLIASVGSNIFEYNDTQVDGGVLFSYIVKAIGVPIAGIESRTINFMDGVGFRNPTATVSGGITYEGGTPVQDVIVFAEPIGAENRSASSLKITDGFASINNFDLQFSDLTLQAWLAGTSRPFVFTTSNGDIYYVEFVLNFTSTNRIYIQITKNGVNPEHVIYNNRINNKYPTGELDVSGKDVFADISAITDETFIHLSVSLKNGEYPIFYLNGRPMTEAYDSEYAEIDITNNNITPTFYTPNPQLTINQMIIQERGGKDFYIDEYRVWNRALSAEEIRRDYRRYLGGNENGLRVYLRMDERVGEYAYDLSKVGFTQNKNDAFLSSNSQNGIQFSDTRPSQQQLGVFGVTDKNGSYIISGISYAGVGESFVITPSLGVHKFEPASQTLFLGIDEPVVNQLNFKDISSFSFRGKAVYNVQNVFDPISSTNPTNLRDSENYNQYLLDDVPINKGEYYYEGGNKNPSTGFYEGGTLQKYPVIPIEGAKILIDGNIVFDEDNQPILSDKDGNFTVRVPIGNHKVEVEKDGHTFALNGRFPETGTFEFFEDQIETRWFIDTTRVSLVGKVVGGKKEFDKPVGFGFNGEFVHTNNEGAVNENKEIISSINNIGIAQITFKGDINSSTLDKIITTNSETGEYKVELIPYQYQILQNGIIIPSNTDIAILSSTETLDLREVPNLKTSKYTTIDNTELESEGYYYEKSFRYNSEVAVYLLEQEFDTEFRIGSKTFDISNLSTPIYTQKKKYQISFEVIQEYVNEDGDSPIRTKEFFTGGTFNITNNLAANGSEELLLSGNNTKYVYSFIAGLPNITVTDGFSSTINVQYIIDGSAPLNITNSNDFKTKGIINGGRSSAGKTFVTSAPEIPEIILRDPPGSNSFASIERGTTISAKTTRSNSFSDNNVTGKFYSVGPDISFSKGVIFSVETSIETVIDVDNNISKTVTNTTKNETLNTYTFNQTISTSDDPEFVGADGDLYIGNAKNIYYGIFDNMFITENIPKDKNNTTIPNLPIVVKDKDNNNQTLYVSSYKDYFIAEQPTNTFFTYSQKYVIETLIPELERLAAIGTSTTTGSVESNNRSSAYYTTQAELWKKVIQKNEKSKYDAIHNRESYRRETVSRVRDIFANNISSGSQMGGLVSDNFYANRSFDAGLGEFTNSITTSVLNEYSYSSTLDLEEEFLQEYGAFVDGVGGTKTIIERNGSVDVDETTVLNEITSTISYTLKDNDKNNLLSVDIVNMFDGNGPVFITRGGATSCPYEGETTSIFFNNDDYDPEIIGTGGEVLSEATNKVYNAEISVERNLITNVPENEAAIFKVYLKNTSETQSDLEFILDVDPLTLNGAKTSIQTNGVSVFLPYNETIEFPVEITKTSSSSTYKYENIKIFLHSPCADKDVKQNIFLELTAEFKNSCSKVNIVSPENNWIFNNNGAYSKDINGNTTTNKLPITFTDFNADFNGFNKIELQYRNASSSNWTKLGSYYGSETLKTTSGDADGIVIGNSDSAFTFNWDIIGDNIPDGNYEFRAVSYCTDDITFTSEIIAGIVNLNAPVVFGTPKPSDGILDVGEDISVRFNEDIFKRTTTNISVTGLKNQQEIDHSVSVRLNGTINQIELPKQLLPTGSFALQFWYKDETVGNATLISQKNGIKIDIKGNYLEFSVGGETISTADVNPPKAFIKSQFNFYSFVYQERNEATPPQLIIIENGVILRQVSLSQNLDINTNTSLFVGGQNANGNIHDIRMWSRPFTAAQATVAKDLTLSGRELNLIGYWKLDEGFGKVGLDKAKRKNAIVNLDWDILPKGTAYEFKNSEYLTLNNVGFVQTSNLEDRTLSFWLQVADYTSGTLFSNGKGDASEPLLTNGYRNKWAVNITQTGHLELIAENVSYQLTTSPIAKNKWTHVAITHKSGGSLNSYIDGNEQSSVSSIKIGGFTGNKILIGARLFTDISNNETIDNHFTGKLDEVRFWNVARSLEQLKRDRYFEIDKESEGLLLYLDFNQDVTNTFNGPAYHHAAANLTTGTTYAVLSGAAQSYIQDSPALKPQLKFTNIPFSTVINGDELIIQPDLTDQEWSLFEGEILNFSVSRLSDTHFNTQLSPVTWTALVNRQELEWFTENQSKEIITEKIVGETYSFSMDIINIGGSNQPFTISGLPIWMSATSASGSVNPNASRQLTFSVDKDLAMGNYSADIFLETASGFNDRLSFNLRVLTQAPDWSVNSTDFEFGMNIIGKIQIDNSFSRDQYTKIGAFVNDEKRGEAYLTYDTTYDSYFVYLTMYSNEVGDEPVSFKIWDAVNGKVMIASVDGRASLPYLNNEVYGTKPNPTVFAGSNLAEQNLDLNKGWTWVSFFTNDTRFGKVDNVFANINPEDGDYIKNQSLFTKYENGSWNGNLTKLMPSEAYKIRLESAKQLRLLGEEVVAEDMDININLNWNWLPFPIHRNISIEEALAFYNPTDGDLLKDQYTFAIYDATSGWSGTLKYLKSGTGYMLKSSKAQVFNYPNSQIVQKSPNTKNISQKSNSNYDADFAQYNSNMNIIAEIITDENYTKVMVFDNNKVLRGIADIIEIQQKKMSFITAFSNKNDELKYVLTDDFEELDLNKSFVFVNDGILGDMKNPIILSNNALSLNDLNLNDFELYPNPFTNELIVDFSKKNKQISKIEVFNTLGSKVFKDTNLKTSKTILQTKNYPKGIYFVRLTDNEGNFAIKKMVKE